MYKKNNDIDILEKLEKREKNYRNASGLESEDKRRYNEFLRVKSEYLKEVEIIRQENIRNEELRSEYQEEALKETKDFNFIDENYKLKLSGSNKEENKEKFKEMKKKLLIKRLSIIGIFIIIVLIIVLILTLTVFK